MNAPVNLLVTLDIHCYPEFEKELAYYLQETLLLLDSLAIKSTVFVPAIVAEKFKDSVRLISNQGHEIACHGLTHGADEQYNALPYEKQKAVLSEAKKRIEGVVGKEVVSFRSPTYKINGYTIRALEESGFKIDSSVNPQRLGIFSSDVTNIGWLYSPRKPYHPDSSNPFRRAKEKTSLWEITQSSFIFPFMTNTGIAFGCGFMKIFYRILYWESCLVKNPIVYMFHPEDICPVRGRFTYRFEWQDLLPSRLRGWRIRYALFHRKAPQKIAASIAALLKTMAGCRNIRFLALRDMLQLFENRS